MFQHLALTTLLVVATAAIPVAQGPVGPKDKPPQTTRTPMRDTEVAVTVEGCIRGDRLKIAPGERSFSSKLLEADEFSLEGPKEMLRQLKSGHEGHHDEISGIAIIPASADDDGFIETKEVGKRTRVTAGSPSRSSNPRPRILRLKVASIRHLEGRCAV